MTLTEKRHEAATKFWQEFKSARYQVEDANGFEYSTGESIFQRKSFVYDLFKDLGSSTEKVNFTVEFEKDSSQILSSWLGAERLI